MTLLSLFTAERGLIASERLVFAPEEIEPLHDSIALAHRLEQHLDAEADRIALACDQARERGYATGLADGLAAAEARTVEQLEAMRAEQHRAARLQREQCSAISLEIVRRLAGEVADTEWLAALALRAAEEMIEYSPLALHVHPERVEAVRGALQGRSTGIESVVADDTLQRDGCALESRVGRVDASLETQLSRLAEVSLFEDLPDASMDDAASTAAPAPASVGG